MFAADLLSTLLLLLLLLLMLLLLSACSSLSRTFGRRTKCAA
jgi:hypothetical protein